GIPATRLRVVVVYDRKKREDHAVLTVFGPDGTLVLDNRYRRVMTWAEMSNRYMPYYSLNENSVWIHSAKV
ncbi:MAG TPA: transglutaminase-like cysteine peptidase, partial [Rhodothermia bacterium]